MAGEAPKRVEAMLEALRIPVRWRAPEGLETVYVNQLVISHAGPEFYLVFGELPMPASLVPTDLPKEVEIIPKVRLAISPAAMKEIARVIGENVAKVPGGKE